MAYTGDWSTLGVDQAWDDWQSQENSSFVAGGAVVQTPNGKLERGEFGKYSGIKQNSDGTYAVSRLRDNKTSDNDYEFANYKLEVGPDDKQRFVQVGDWTPETRNSGWEKNLKAAAGMGAVMLGGAAMGGAFGGAGAGLGGALPGGIEATVGGLEAGAGAGGYGAALPSAATASSIWDPVGAYLTGGGVDGSIVGGAGGHAGAISGLPEVLTRAIPGSTIFDLPSTLPGGIEDTVGGQEAGTGAGGGGASVPGASSNLPAGLLDYLKDPALAKLIGPLIGGLLADKIGGDKSGGNTQPRMNMAPQAMTQQAPTLKPWEPSVGLPSGLGSQSAGLFDEYMKKQLNGGRRTYYAPTFGAKP